MALEMSPYKVYKKTFLSSVRWLFSYSAEEKDFVDRFIPTLESLSYELDGKETKAVKMKKPGIVVLANAELVFVNCAVNVYKGFDVLKLELISILAALEKLGVQEIKAINCVKENVFSIDRAKAKSKLTESLFASVLFTEAFAANPVFADSRDGIQAVVTRSFSDTVSESVMRLLVAAGWSSELPTTAAADKLQEIDKVSYDAWSSVVSDGVKKIMEG